MLYKQKIITTLLGSAGLLLAAGSARAGTNTWDFTTDPTTGANPIEVYQEGNFKDTAGNQVYWKAAGGNPGGFLGLTWPVGGSSAIIIFPDIDQGKTVTAFKLEADLRIGNPQQDARAADGFSINFARSNDPVFETHASSSFATSGAVETGTTTGLAISFDTWSGNALPDGNDIEGIIVRVDNRTVLRHAMPTRNGACNDATSLQTGPRNLDYWTAVKALPPPDTFVQYDNVDAAFAPDSWTNLCWQHLSVEVDNLSRVTVIWKGVTVLDHFQTDFFPSAGGLVLAGRTGGADEHTHFDNLKLTTSSSAADTNAPAAPTGLKAVSTGSARVALSWDPAIDDSGRVAYAVERDGVVLAGVVSETNYVDLAPVAGKAYTYRVRAYDVSLNYSPYATLQVTTAAEAPVPGSLKIELYDNITGTAVGDLLAASKYPASPDRGSYTVGLIAGIANGNAGWNDSFGDNYGMRITGTITPTETASYDFFIRSDDASALYLNKTGPALPVPGTDIAIAEETDCCDAFQEPGSLNDDGGTSPTTTTPIPLTAGTSYGFVVLMKEGGGGDGVAVGWRKVGDTTAAADLPPITGLVLKGASDPVGPTLDITSQPSNVSVMGNEKASFSVTATNTSPYGAGVWYQWLKGGVPIYGANSATYNIAAAPTNDTGAQFSVAVGTVGLVKTSSVATLTVSADTKKPTITGVTQLDDTFTKLRVNFSEPVTSPTASTAGNYTLSGGATVSSAALSSDAFSVTLTTSKLNENTEYTLTTINVADIGGNAVAANTQTKFNTWVKVLPGDVKIEIYNDISGTAVNLLTAAPAFPNSPNSTETSTNGLTIGNVNGNAGWNDSYGDNYGMRITGTLTPPGTGQYNFFIRSDDASQFFLNQNGPALPAITGTPTAAENGCCNAFQEPGATQTSAAISLTNGVQYGFVVLLKEGGGGDGVAVGMRAVGDTTPAANLPAINIYAPKFTAAPAGPSLSIGKDGSGNVVITFQGTLQSTTNIVAPTWTTVTGTGSVTVTPTSTPTFYRAQQ